MSRFYTDWTIKSDRLLEDTVALLNRTPWRDLYPVHPAAELFPLLSREELTDFAADIRKRGMLMPILVRHHDAPAGPGVPEFDIVDGRSRLDAMTLAGLPLFASKDGTPVPNFGMVVLNDNDDPYAVAISANLKRRHLTAAQRREAISKYVARSDQSDRQISLLFGVDHKTVGAVRKQGEATGEISPVDRTIGADGKSRPVKRQPRKTAAPAKTPPQRTAPARAAAFEQPAEARRDENPDADEIKARAEHAIWIRQATRDQIEQFVAEFGIPEPDLDQLFALFNARESDIVVEDPLGRALELVNDIGIEFTKAYVAALEQTIEDRLRPIIDAILENFDDGKGRTVAVMARIIGYDEADTQRALDWIRRNQPGEPDADAADEEPEEEPEPGLLG